MIRRKTILITFPIFLLIGIYALGPQPHRPKWLGGLPSVPQEPTALETYIAQQESKHALKPDNQARIVWADSTKRKTAIAVIYLHGFSASQEEGNPVHRDFARKFGCNLYLARIADHGVDTTEQLLYFTPDRAWTSVKEALAIGKAIGDKVIVMSTSTGGSLALLLASEFSDDVHALINYSPNIEINQGAAFLLNNPWGLQIARAVFGSNYQQIKYPASREQYWNSKYRLESLTQLEEMLEDKMNNETFAKVKKPSLTLYYYRNEKEQDPTVKVSAMLIMHKGLGTPDSLKRAFPVPNAEAHVIAGNLASHDVESVMKLTEQFAVEVLHLKKVIIP